MRNHLIISGLMLLLGGSVSLAQFSGSPAVNLDSLRDELAKDSLTSQRVDSRKGYVAGVPASALLDSSQSGWNPQEMYEQRLYILREAGEISFRVMVEETSIPDSATVTAAYTYLDEEELTSAGTLWRRTYYLPSRSVRIEIRPYSSKMYSYTEERERIFASFRWKPGAESTRIDVDAPTPSLVPEPPKRMGIGS